MDIINDCIEYSKDSDLELRVEFFLKLGWNWIYVSSVLFENGICLKSPVKLINVSLTIKFE